jgi:uncharacterized protein YyaL (SSP411 family)
MTGSTVGDFVRSSLSRLHPRVARLYLARRHRSLPAPKEQLEAAIAWLFRAQDAAGNGGVARGYSLVRTQGFGPAGWQPAYPETTGYIIPTLFDYAHMTGREEAFARAVRMAEWECKVQMASGAVQGGTIDHEQSPAIFNTGQVIFGWIRAWRETDDARYLESAVRAGDYLVSQQDPDGAWRKNLSRFASHEMPSYTYNTRTAWALFSLASFSGNAAYRDAATRNVEHALTEQTANGFFRNNCLDDSERALLHTISYCLRGILEVGAAIPDHRFLDSVVRATHPLIGAVRRNGSLPGRFDPRWKAAARWSCLTGNSQFALVLGRLHQVVGGDLYLDALRRINRFQRSVQILRPSRPEVHGSILGSYPVHGRYAQFEIPSWAVKFFIDALLIEIEIDEGRGLLLDLRDTGPGPMGPAGSRAGVGSPPDGMR